MGCTHCKATWQNVGLLNHWVNNRNGSPVNFRFIWNQCKQRQFCDSISATLCDRHLPYDDMFTQKFNLYKKNVSELKVTSSISNSFVWNTTKKSILTFETLESFAYIKSVSCDSLNFIIISDYGLLNKLCFHHSSHSLKSNVADNRVDVSSLWIRCYAAKIRSNPGSELLVINFLSIDGVKPMTLPLVLSTVTLWSVEEKYIFQHENSWKRTCDAQFSWLMKRGIHCCVLSLSWLCRRMFLQFFFSIFVEIQF